MKFPVVMNINCYYILAGYGINNSNNNVSIIRVILSSKGLPAVLATAALVSMAEEQKLVKIERDDRNSATVNLHGKSK